MDPRKFTKPGASPGTVPPQAVALDDKQLVSEPADATVAGVKDHDPQTKRVIQGYLDYLKEHDISEQDIFSVLDTILTSGDVYWQFDLLDKIPVVLKMRPKWVDRSLMDVLDKDVPKSQARFVDIVNTFNLAGSLVKYGDYGREVSTQEDLDANIKFISALPYALQNRLVKQQAVFDRVVAVATSDWAVENFSKPLSEE